jgi:predicted dehydrogenase
MSHQHYLNRRAFLSSAAAVGAFTLVPRSVLGGAGHIPPSETIQVAGIGIGGVGSGQIRSIAAQSGVRISALCDVDDVYAQKTYDRFPDARRYRDFRHLLAKEGDKIDAVYCGTPDHTHAVICQAALKQKKHLCCVKPLTRTMDEMYIITESARRAGVATQVTASANTGKKSCRLIEMIQAGAIGEVREVHIWSNRPLWPHGMLRPPGADPIPNSLDWDLWLGPAPMRPFKNEWPDGHLALAQVLSGRPKKAVYHPWNFRGWWNFGTGALGDMGCHHFNTTFKALKLTYPARISASATRVFDESAPLSSIVTYDFPARPGMPPCRVVWYDGGLKPPRPAELEDVRALRGSGNLYIGTKGKILGGTDDGRIIPESKMKAYRPPKRRLESRSGTWGEWVEAIRGGEPAGCHFDWAAYITAAVLLGNIAIRTGKTLDWNARTRRFTNYEPANEFLKEPYRGTWSLA